MNALVPVLRRLLALALLVTPVLLLPACGEAPADGATQVEKQVPVRVARVSSGPSLPAIRAHGIVMVKDASRLSFKVGGVIASIEVEPGQRVRRGDRLARIEQTEIGAATEQSRQMAQKARRDLERGEKLYQDQVITLEQVQDLRTQAAMADAGLKSAQFNQRYALIEAPFDGVVLRKLAQERELVTAGQPILALSREGEGYVVKAALSDREIVQSAIGDVAQVELDAFPGQAFSARLTEVASAADEKTGMFDIEAQLDVSPANLKSGLVARLKWQPQSLDGTELAYVPFAAIVEGNGGEAFVYELVEGRAVKRAVQIAFIDRERVALRAGIAPGATVIAEGAQFVADGSAVKVKADDETVATDRLAQAAG